MTAAQTGAQVVNDDFKDGARAGLRGQEYLTRRDEAMKAYHEWLPTRVDPESDDPEERIKYYRTHDFGDLARLNVLETRLVARTNMTEAVERCTGEETFPRGDHLWLTNAAEEHLGKQKPQEWDEEALRKLKECTEGERWRRDKELLGKEQRDWLVESLASSEAKWNLIGSQTVMMENLWPDLNETAQKKLNEDPEIGAQWMEAFENATLGTPGETHIVSHNTIPHARDKLNASVVLTEGVQSMARVTQAFGQHRINWNYDSWKGYMADREWLIRQLANVSNPVVLSGDSHNAWAGWLSRNDSNARVAVEFGGNSVTSPGFEDSHGAFAPLDFLSRGFLEANEAMVYQESGNKGTVLVTIRPDELLAEFIHAPSEDRTDLRAASEGRFFSCSKALKVNRGERGMLRETECETDVALQYGPYTSSQQEGKGNAGDTRKQAGIIAGLSAMVAIMGTVILGAMVYTVFSLRRMALYNRFSA